MENTENTHTMLPKVKQSPHDSNEYIYSTLPNGLKCLVIFDKDADKSAASLNVSIGSLLDPENYHGLAHFLEHMLFMGTVKYPREKMFSDFLTKNAGNSNAYTDLSSTNFHFDVSNEAFPKALDMFAQFFIAPLFHKGSVEREILAVDSEHKKNLRNDDDRFVEIMRTESHLLSPFRKFQTGCEETLKKDDIRDQLISFYSRYYSANLMTLCVLSNVHLQEMYKTVTDLFEKIKSLDITHEEVISRYIPDGIYPYRPSHGNLSYFYAILPIKETDTLTFSWIINEDMNKYYKSDPLEYIVSLLSHEGPNSLTSSLLKDELINDLECSTSVIGDTYTELSVSANLTEKGVKEYKAVMTRVFAYIKTLQLLPINKGYFNEIQKMSAAEFEYFEKDDPLDTCCDLAQSMTVYSPEDTIMGAYVLQEYDEHLIQKYLNMIQYDNLNVYISSKSFWEDMITSKHVLTENWYGTKYTKEYFDFSSLLIDETVDELNFNYPPKNIFIPQNFNLIDFKGNDIDTTQYEFPKKILTQHDFCSVWYKPDFTFKVPKVFLASQVYLSNSCLDYNRFHAYADLWWTLAKEELKETLYMGELAGLSISMSFNISGMSLDISGYNDTLKIFSHEIFSKYSQLFNLDNIVNLTSKLVIKIKDAIKDLKNTYLAGACTQVGEKLRKFLKNPCLNTDMQIEIYEELEEYLNTNKSIHNSQLEIFVKNYINKSSFEWLVQGNILQSEALEIISYIQDTLRSGHQSDMTFDEVPGVQIVSLPSSKVSYYHIFESKDTENENSAIVSYFQIGNLNHNLKQYALLQLIEQIYYDDFFDELRTKRTLGYCVDLRRYFVNKIHGLACFVQSSTKSPEYIYNKINDFFLDFDLNDEEVFNDEDYSSYLSAVITDLKQKDLNLGEEFDRHFEEIQAREYMFNRHKLLIQVFENEIKKEDVVEFFNEYILKKPRRIDIEIIGCNHKEENIAELQKNLDNLPCDGNRNKMECDNEEEEEEVESGEEEEEDDEEEEIQYTGITKRIHVQSESEFKSMCEYFPEIFK